MAAKILLFDEEARRALERGVNQLADAIISMHVTSAQSEQVRAQ